MIQKENNCFNKDIEEIIIHRYQNDNGTYELKLLNMNDVIENTKIISDEINPTRKYVTIYKNSLKQVFKALELEKVVTKECEKQVAAATAEYKVRLDASEKRNEASDREIQELKSKDQIKDAKLEASDKEIQQLKAENLIFKRELEEIKLKLSL